MWFEGFTNLSSLDLTNLDTSDVTNMSEMFVAVAVEVDNVSFDLSSLNTSNVTSMDNIPAKFSFGDKFDTSKVTDMSYMFSDFGNENTKMSSIGRLSIPDGVNFEGFASSSPAFVGDLYITGYLCIADNCAQNYFLDAATVDGSRINLYYNDSSFRYVEECVYKYGPDSNNHGNIYAIELTS